MRARGAWAQRWARSVVPESMWTMIDEDLREGSEEVEARWGSVAATAWLNVQYLLVASRLSVQHGGDTLRSAVAGFASTGWGLDFTLAVRRLRLRAARSAVIVATIALAIGSTTAVFTVVHGVLLRPLDFPEPDRLVQLWQTRPDWRSAENESFRQLADQLRPQAPEVLEWAASDLGMDEVGAYVDAGFVVTGAAGAEAIKGQEASSGLFAALGVEPLAGRVLAPRDDEAGAEPVVVLSEALWESRFGRAGDVLGQSMTIRDRPHTIVGVMPAGFRGPSESRFDQLLPEGWPMLWTPLSDEALRGWKNVLAVARLRDGVSVELAENRLIAHERAWAEENPGTGRAQRPPRVEPLLESVVGSSRTTLWFLMGAVGLVFLVAALNIVNVVIATGHRDRRDVAVRVALGAGSGRVMRGLFLESGLATALGGACGVLLAWLMLPVMTALLPPGLPRAEGVSMSWPVIGFGVAVTAVAATIVGALPAFGAARTKPQAVIRSSDRAVTESRGAARARSVLVVAEVAAAFVLLVSAGLLATSFDRLWSVERGFDTEGLVSVRISPDWDRYPEAEDLERLHNELDAAFDAVPGARAAAVNSVPLSGLRSGQSLRLDGVDGDAGDVNVTLTVARPDYLDVLGVEVVQGRQITDSDQMPTEAVALVNQTLADRLWPSGAVGGRVRLGDDTTRVVRVVGVVADVRHTGLAVEVEPKVIVPAAQWGRDTNEWLFRVEGDVDDVVAGARRALAEVAPSSPVTRVMILERQVRDSVAVPRFRALFVTGLALLAGVLALLGLYGVLAFSVTARLREMGVRMALGATGGSVVRDVVRSGIRLAVWGIVLGSAGAWLASGLLTSFLYSVEATHPVVYGGIAATVLVVSVVAALGPARRAARLNLVEVLGAE